MRPLVRASSATILFLSVLLGAASVYAQPHYGPADWWGHPRTGQSYTGYGSPGFHPPPYAASIEGPGYGPPRYARPIPPGYDPERPARSGWRRGQYLPPDFRGEVVSDYARFHLRRPPRGYFWYRDAEDYVLAAASTGLIFEVIPGY